MSIHSTGVAIVQTNKTSDMVGHTYGRWTIIGLGAGKQKLIGRCECGLVRSTLYAPNLKSGKSRSCGCLAREEASKRSIHGRTGTKEYWVWKEMIYRCTSKWHKNYNLYGGRGISVCREWYDIEKFISDMGPKPSVMHSLERVDNNKGYSKENCIWATKSEQSRNTRRTKIVNVGGEAMCAKDACEASGISYTTFRSRCEAAGVSEQEGADLGLLEPSDRRFTCEGQYVRDGNRDD